MHRAKAWSAWLGAMMVMVGCHEEAPPAGACETASCLPPDTPRTSPSQQQDLTELKAKLAAVEGLSGEQLVSQSALPFTAGLGYDPLTASGLDRIKASSLAPSAEELTTLQKQGFSIANGKSFPTFTYGYATLYLEDLPVYISADSLLHAVHRSYDAGLLSLEGNVLLGEVRTLLTGLRAQLASGGSAWLTAESRGDLDLVLALGLSLLDGKLAPVVAGGDSTLLAQLYDKAKAAEGGMTEVRLFGANRLVDFSQFKPRGHYVGQPALEQYFRAMMWFGRTEFRMIETNEQGQQIFQRRQFEAALGLVELMDAGAKQRFSRIDQAIGLFVGENDAMTVPDGEHLLSDLGVSSGAGLAALSDEALVKAIVDGGYGSQRIASQLMINDRNKTMPLHRAFQLFGQRYTVDSHVFSNVVFDRAGGGAIKRMMPDPLDAAYGALGNDQAASLLAPQLSKYAYAPDLASMRILVDAHETAYWDSSLYTLWLSSLRALSPSKDSLASAGLPRVATTEAWGRRLLNTQLASWAELRHDTLLYAKQSYTGGASCEFPDAYVDPYPAFYQNLTRYAERGEKLTQTLSGAGAQQALAPLATHFGRLREVSTRLADMAQRQLTGQTFTAEQMAFINEAVVIKKEDQGCTTVEVASGWYPNLFLADPLVFDPTIADVHTQPTDEGGAPVGRVLHVTTGQARRLIVTVDTCQGPRAYAGLVSSYGEKVTEKFERLSDEEWMPTAQNQPWTPTPWMSPLISP